VSGSQLIKNQPASIRGSPIDRSPIDHGVDSCARANTFTQPKVAMYHARPHGMRRVLQQRISHTASRYQSRIEVCNVSHQRCTSQPGSALIRRQPRSVGDSLCKGHNPGRVAVALWQVRTRWATVESGSHSRFDKRHHEQRRGLRRGSRLLPNHSGTGTRVPARALMMWPGAEVACATGSTPVELP